MMFCPDCGSASICNECVNVTLQMIAYEEPVQKRINVSSGEDAILEDEDVWSKETRAVSSNGRGDDVPQVVGAVEVSDCYC